ncbi:trifunctional serine/threonine-protein kinase/ATP-binding protein/sensor histidine kinase [Phenylobacterium hankyongense]|uniref:trifunctional serine/threonine-protein kinase/ATP-binding protein/sensor histidine kinase n=1 Tax=Phenylobacterium hankyongense TaxID=1813876 RepID=UPI001A9DB3AE|nr:trifunctional serine/threonine-protein kinase/ATP-binding protein/sensor histidine kinase [Phenylobacterium hankyongense]
MLAVLPAAEQPTPASLDRLAHEYGLRAELAAAGAVRPLELVRQDGRAMLLLEDPGGEPLAALLGAPMEVGRFLRLALALTSALGRVHERGLIHKDLKPAHILVNPATGEVRLTGFGIASRLPRERQSPEPPEVIAGTLAYMAPEQTGRMNRSIDSRSDLYALGITLYQTLTGALPFNASDPMEWVHCHVARKPVPPAERLKQVPGAVSAIIMKLLAKTAEDRYQTAAGLESDLRRCLDQWVARRRCEDLPLGQFDTPDRLLIPEKLYGREREIATLLAAFGRVVQAGAPALVLVSGYSGIGKSSVVHELHKGLVPPRGLFASGKFDQYKRDIPYSTLAQAFQSLLRPLLGKSEAEMAPWREALSEALGPNARLIVDLVPELTLIIGDQPPVPELPHQHAKGRFQLVIRRFLGVFARPEQPLALFLDDVQWLDAATLDVIEDLLTQPDVRHLILISAYRDNEVSATHPLMRKLDAIRKAGADVQEIVLAPLAREDLGRLIAESLHCAPERAAPLAQLVHEKTAGNPFFAIQFLSALVDEQLVTFDHGAARWSWDLHRIHAKGYTDNVVDLMVGKLSRLPANTRKALRQLACLGDHAESALLAMVYEDPGEALHADLQDALQTGLVLYSDGVYRFLHDRVQEAAYSLIPEAERATTHLRIGRLLAARTAPAEIEEKVFELVNQLNRASHLVTDVEERERVAELNLIAARRAKMSTAYASALAYLAAGRALLSEDIWARNYPLVFAIEFHMAECALLTADMTAAEDRLTRLARRAEGVHDVAAVARLRLTLYTTLDRSDRGVEVCLEYLQRGGTQWPPHPTSDQVRGEYDRIWSQLGGRSIEDLVDLPLMQDPDALADLEVLTEVVTPALFTDERLLSLVICRMVNLSLEHGNSDGSCFAYVWLGMIAGPHFGAYEAGFRFGRLGHDLVEQRGLRRFQARTYMSFGNLVMPWTRHVQSGRDLVRRAFETANSIGDLTFAAYSRNNLNTNLLATGDPLDEVQREAEYGLEFAEKARFGLVVDIITTQLGLVRTLRGLTPRFGAFDIDELSFERHLADDPRLALPECWYWIRKLQARFFAGDHAEALDAAARAQRLLWTSPSFFEMAEYHFYAGLCHAAACDTAPPDQRSRHLEALAGHHRQLEVWAEHCPENFENRSALASAELARLEGRALDAEQLYETAIRSAHLGGFVHNEAIAYERASAFYRARGFEPFADLYLRSARYGYLRWGADGKVRQLDQLHPQLPTAEPAPDRTSTMTAPIEHLDLATVIKVSQAMAGETVPETLIDTILRTAIEHAGAARGLLILSRGDEPRIAAEATTEGDAVIVHLRDAAVTAAALPQTVLHYVLRTRDSLVLDDAVAQAPFAADPYVRQQQARSVLCLPLLNQAKLVGVLYLENNLTSLVFAPARIPMLKLLASEAAISLENARLYRDLASREARIRRLVDANIIGIILWDLDGQVIEANDAFLRIVGYDREDLVSGRVRWTDLTPPEWSGRDLRQWMPELKTAGSLHPYEKEYLRKDGGRVPVLIGAASFEESGNQGVAFVLDLTELKRAEAEARESERRYREVHMELAHANRVASMGQLAASIAHEVNQPIAAAAANADAALRWLRAPAPDLDEVRQALDRIVANAARAGGVIGRIRALIKKAPPHRAALDINEGILEVVALTQGETVKDGVTLQTELADDLPPIQGDQVEFQQVILNLILNALQAMSGVGDGPRDLRISTATDAAGDVLVTVRDSGPGLSPESLESLFEAFYTTKPEGLGMGLAISRSIVVAHGGRMWASANEPRGASFQFTLPPDPAGNAPSADAQSSDVQPGPAT